MIKLFSVAFTIIAVFFYSCNCDKIINCGSLSSDALVILNANQNDTIAFVNSAGLHLLSIVNGRTVSAPYELKACRHSGLGCSCDYQCAALGSMLTYTDSGINGINKYSIEIAESSVSNRRTYSVLTYRISGFSAQIELLNSQLYPGDSLLSLVQLGNVSYTNVYVHQIDTMNNAFQNIPVLKGYFTKTKGLVGFVDKLSKTLFYLE